MADYPSRGRGGRGGGQRGGQGQGGRGRGGGGRGGGRGGATTVWQQGSAPSSATAEQRPAQPRPSQPPAQPPAQQYIPLTEEEVMKSLDLTLLSLERVRPVRPSVGTKGRAIKLLANFYQMKIPTADVYHYDVTVTPETRDPINRRVMDIWRVMNGTPEAKIAVYDGRKNLYSPRKLKLIDEVNGDEVDVTLDKEDSDKPQVFRVKVKIAATVNMERLHRFIDNKGENDAPRDALQVFDVLLKHRPNMNFMSVSRKTGGAYFGAYDPRFNITAGLNLRNGWKQSVRPTYHDILLNIDVATTCYYQSGPLLNVVAAFFNRQRIQDVNSRSFNPQSVEFQRLSKFLTSVVIEVTHRDTGRRRYKIRRLSRELATTSICTVTSETPPKKVSVEDYFKRYVRKPIQFPHLPLLECGTDGKVLLPMEFCVIRPGQRHLGKLSEAQTSDVIKIAAVSPPERQARIKEGRDNLHGDSAKDDLLKAWGVSISPNMKTVDARILNPPVITGSGEIRPQNGAFDFSKIPEKFFRPATLSVWSVAVFGEPRNSPKDAVIEFMTTLFRGCASKGMTIAPRNWNDVVVPQLGKTIEETLELAGSLAVKAATTPERAPPGPQMIFCIMERGGSVYEEIKFFAETKLGVMTQCLLNKHLRNTKPGVSVNLALKINAKLGGVNCVVDPAKQLNVLGQPVPTMIMGADVTHPPAGAGDGGVSIAAVVASMDAKFAEYRAAIRVQPPRMEIIGKLGDITAELLGMFRARARGRFPSRIIFYRDGVSEGQFGEVSLQEVQSLKRALREMGAGDVKLTFLIVNKRHAARFFAANPRDADRKGNVMAGTVVDSGITHPFEFDFYLNSHQGLQGTSRSAHYHVLYDENKFSADDLQEFTYRMCYLFARATRSVSIVPSAYYAHLVAARARCYRPGGVSGSSQYAGGSTTSGIESARAADFMEVTKSLQNSMYFT